MNRILLTILTIWAALGAIGAPRVSLLTAAPGGEVFQLEGHSALRVTDPEAGVDYVVNWGVFDFNTPNFVGRFVAGETDYLCMAYPTRYFFGEYAAEGREVTEQVLALDSLQTAGLIGLIGENLRPENRVYRYNYVRDNCATRPLAFIEAAAGRKLLGDAPEGTTWRNEMRRYHRDFPWYQFGIDLALGRGIDAPISEREAAFAPVFLRDRLPADIVGETRTYGSQTLRNEPTPWPLTPMAAALAVLLLSLGACLMKRPQWVDSLLFGVFFILGCLLTYLIFISTHEATSPNLLLLWLNPFCLLGAVLPWLKSAKKAEISYFFVNFALLILLAVLVPLLGRGMNPAFWPLIAADAVRSLDNIRRCTKTVDRS